MVARIESSHFKRFACTAVLVFLSVVLTACGSNGAESKNGDTTTGSQDTQVNIVAAESFWGSIASQLGGERVKVESIISRSGIDPHDYEPSPKDVAALAKADIVILNGLGYDEWASKALEANPSKSRSTLNVGTLVGLKKGDNPHRWYSPKDVDAVISKTTEILKTLDTKHAAYYDAQKADFISQKLARYNGLRAEISQRFSGSKIGSTESIMEPLVQDLKLQLITPTRYLSAVSEGRDPLPADVAEFERQIDTNQLSVFVFNKQNTTASVQKLVDKANAKNIPVVAVTETPDSATQHFQDWQSAQLQQLLDALSRATKNHG